MQPREVEVRARGGVLIPTALLLSALVSAPESVPRAGRPAAVDLDLLVCQATRAQEAVELRWREFEYVKEHVIESLDGGRIASRSSETTYVHRTCPAGIEVSERIAKDGARLSAESAAEENARTERRLRQLRQDTREHARAESKAREASDEMIGAISVIRSAYDVRYEGDEWIGDEPCHVVSFFPRASFRPRTQLENAIHNMGGVAWLTAGDSTIRRLEAEFIGDMSAKYGPFATITAGSHVSFDQGDAAEAAPLLLDVALDLHLRLFFVLHRDQRQLLYFRDFRRANPAPERTLVP